ncbi:MAG: SGNH/GDSL hydrolase family protein [Bryobacteraceae bacterium]|nr:SGNH/GDSL hydrolase family protein [Bryobacteraceae bacterium]
MARLRQGGRHSSLSEQRMRAASTVLTASLLFLLAAPPSRGPEWEAIHEEMYEALSRVSKEYFESGRRELPGSDSPLAAAAEPAVPWLIAVGFTGGVEGRDSTASGVVAMKNRLGGHVAERNDVLAVAYNNFRWRRAAADVLEAIRRAGGDPGFPAAVRQPLIVVYGHSWGAGSIDKFARELAQHGLEISLAIYIDAFGWRNPRVPGNVRHAVNFYQRAGILNGLPLRGKAKLIARDPARTQILGNYEISPDAGRWGWSWNPLQPLFYRQHHLIAHDLRLRKYLIEIVNLKLEMLNRARATAAGDSAPGLFDRVVILGASVSAGEKATSPGLLLARHMGTPEERIFTFAEGGAASEKHLGYLDNIGRLQPTLIVALDLFFHDFRASLYLSRSKKQYLREYLASLDQTGAAVMVGNIPSLVLLRYQHVNDYLEQLATEFPNLVLVDVQRLIDSLEHGVPLRIAGEEILVKKQDVFADHVHPNLLGSTLLANYLLERLQTRFPELAAAGAPRLLPLPRSP